MTNEELENKIQNLENILFRVMDFLSVGSEKSLLYQFVLDETVRRQLELDYILMEKTPASDFNKYCQYSFFQIENLLNYYYTRRFAGNTEEAKKYFASTEDSSDELKTLNSFNYRVSKISFGTKYYKFGTEILVNGNKKPTPLNKNIQNITYVRNSSLHRNSADIDKYEDDMLKEFERVNKIQREKQDEWDAWNLGIKIQFKRKCSFSLVKRVTNEFAEVIKKEIEKYQNK